MFEGRKAADRFKVGVHMCVCVSVSSESMFEEPVRDNVSCLYEGEVQPNEALLSPPTASPTVTLGR